MSIVQCAPNHSILTSRQLFLTSAPLTTGLPATPAPPLQTIRASRERYVELLKEKMRAPDGSYEDGLVIPGFDTATLHPQTSSENWSRNNPLSLDEDSGWRDWFKSVELRVTIKQDVERTYAISNIFSLDDLVTRPQVPGYPILPRGTCSKYDVYHPLSPCQLVPANRVPTRDA